MLVVIYSGNRSSLFQNRNIIIINILLNKSYYDDNWNAEQLEVKEHEMNILYELSEKYNFELYIGGQAFEKLAYDYNKKEIIYI